LRRCGAFYVEIAFHDLAFLVRAIGYRLILHIRDVDIDDDLVDL